MIVSSDQTSRTDYRPSVQQVPLRRIVQKHYPLNRRSETDFSSPITFQLDDRPPLEFIRSCQLRMPLKAVFSSSAEQDLGLPVPVGKVVKLIADGNLDHTVTIYTVGTHESHKDIYRLTKVLNNAVVNNVLRSDFTFKEPALKFQEASTIAFKNQVEKVFDRIICKVNQLTTTREPERLAWLQEHLVVDTTGTYNFPSNGDHVNFMSGKSYKEHPFYDHRSLNPGRLDVLTEQHTNFERVATL